MTGLKICFPDCHWPDWPEKPIAGKVLKKVTTFGKNIRPGQCQPYTLCFFWKCTNIIQSCKMSKNSQIKSFGVPDNWQLKKRHQLSFWQPLFVSCQKCSHQNMGYMLIYGKPSLLHCIGLSENEIDNTCFSCNSRMIVWF